MKTITEEQMNEILHKHELWLNDEEDGEQAGLSCANLSEADLDGANLRDADLRGAGLSGANMFGANLRGADLRKADLRGAKLFDADLNDTDLRGANLRGADLRDANLHRADLFGADLCDVNLSGAKGLLSSIEFMQTNFDTIDEGYIVYKCFGATYCTPPTWDIKENSIISEVCNPNRTDDCGSGINVASMEWVKKNYGYKNLPIWKLLIKWEWFPGVVVPYNTDGKIRCERAMLLEVVKE